MMIDGSVQSLNNTNFNTQEKQVVQKNAPQVTAPSSANKQPASRVDGSQESSGYFPKDSNSPLNADESKSAAREKKNGDFKEDVIHAIEQANKKLKNVSTEFEFSIHEKTKQITVKIMNTETREVIRELPPEKILDMVAKMWEMAGILVDEKR